MLLEVRWHRHLGVVVDRFPAESSRREDPARRASRDLSGMLEVRDTSRGTPVGAEMKPHYTRGAMTKALTLQEIFTRAYLGLASQNFEICQGGEAEVCMYNGPNDTHCALGWVIGDLVPAASNEDPVDKLLGFVTPIRERIGGVRYETLHELQCCHDQARDPESMRVRLERFATKHDLEIPET